MQYKSNPEFQSLQKKVQNGQSSSIKGLSKVGFKEDSSLHHISDVLVFELKQRFPFQKLLLSSTQAELMVFRLNYGCWATCN